MSFQVAYVPIGVGTFHLESAQDQFEKSIAMLKGLNADCTVPEKMLLTINDLDAYLDTLNPDLIVLQNITFANAAYASEVLKRFACPIVLWTLREPVIDGTRLRLNSLTALTPPATPSRRSGARASLNISLVPPARPKWSGKWALPSVPPRSSTTCAASR